MNLKLNLEYCIIPAVTSEALPIKVYFWKSCLKVLAKVTEKHLCWRVCVCMFYCGSALQNEMQKID